MAAAPRTARERARAHFTADLLASARAHLVSDGAANLSLRAVARDLGVSSSAVYRYVPSRDALLTLLIIEAYDAVGDGCERAAAAAERSGLEPAQQWLAAARAFVTWARANRHSYELIYGTPVPGYAAPQDTVAAATRVWGVVAGVIRRARAQGLLHPTGPALDVDGLLEPAVLDFARGGPDAPPLSRQTELDVARSLTLFAALLGATTAELFGHFHSLATDDDRVIDAVVATAAAGVGLIIDLDAAPSWPGSRTARRPA